MEDMSVGTGANKEPIIVDQHYGISDLSGFQSIQGGPSYFQTPANNSFFNMGTPTNWQTPMPSQPGSSNWQSQMPAYTPTPNWQPLIPLHPGDAGLLHLIKSIIQTCSKSDTLRWIAERVSVSGTTVVEVFASVVIGVVYPRSVGKFRGNRVRTLEARLQDMVEEPVVSVATTTKSIPISTAEVVTTANQCCNSTTVSCSNLIEIKNAKPSLYTTTASRTELMNRRKKHFAKLRAEEIRRKPPTKAQKRNQMSTYLKNMAGSTYSMKRQNYDEILSLFDKEIEKSEYFCGQNSEKIDEHVETKKDDDPEEEEMKKHIEIVQDEEEIAIDAIPLTTKPPMIVKYKIVKEGQKGFYYLIRADGSLKRYSSMIRMLQGLERCPDTAYPRFPLWSLVSPGMDTPYLP
ncbi:hypothetical protein Tco_0348759 [Tanacetum coccineum]